ncbi:MAG: glycoside hydrolase family 2 protein [Planctomycetota bacterium]|jgi:hypothetical protein
MKSPLRDSFAAIMCIVATGSTSFCSDQFAVPLPPGVKAVWDMAQAHHETTPTRERICINGLWRFQPAEVKTDQVPQGNWGFFKVPGPWPEYRVKAWMADESQKVYRHPSWEKKDFKTVDLAWHQREFTLPKGWAGRRITLWTEWLNSYAGVFVDGKPVGEIYYPGGELDITTACRPREKQVLSLLVAAMPRGQAIAEFAAKRSPQHAKQPATRSKKEGIGSFRGPCGDVFLSSTPAGARIGDVKVNTSVRQWEIELDAAVTGLKAGQQCKLRGRLFDGDKEVKALESKLFSIADLSDGRLRFSSRWQPEKLWDLHTPQNQYELKLSLVDSAGKLLDEFAPVRFGFREFWIDGRDFRLSGTRIWCMAVPLDNSQMSPAACTYQAACGTFRRLKSIGINTVYGHNYNCLPGTHLGFDAILKAADDTGMLVCFCVPRYLDYGWRVADKEPEKTSGYWQDAEFYVRRAVNHPAVVMYAAHSGLGYAQDQNPDRIDKGAPGDRHVDYALRVERTIHAFDTTRPIYHHAGSGQGLEMYTINNYLDFAPIQERSEWYGHWAQKGSVPLFLVEYGFPLDFNWLNYKEGYVLFGSPMTHELLLPEWGSQFFGDRAYRLTEEEKQDIRFEAEQWRTQKMFHKSLYPAFEASHVPNLRDVQAMYLADNWPAFRTWGISGVTAWSLSRHWLLRAGVGTEDAPCEVDWNELQRPGYSPDFIRAKGARWDVHYQQSDWTPNSVTKTLMRYNQPLLAYIAGKPERFTSKDHNFLPGESVEKQIIVINNSRQAVACDCSWTLALPTAIKGSRQFRIETGQQERAALRFDVPAGTKPGRYTLTMAAKFSTGEVQEDTLVIDVLPPAEKPVVNENTALFDPKGETAKLLGELGVKFEKVDADADLSGFEVFVLGKKALTPFGPGPDISRVRDGLKVIVFEQTQDVLEKRFGFRVQEHCLRQVFPRVAGHPILDGLDAGMLANWRGEGTTIPARMETGFMNPRRGWPKGQWAGFTQRRVWRVGCYGSVASLLMEKPACGDFLPVCDGGFSLQYSPLMEYRDGKGMILFCQMDVTGRTETDPAAARIVKNALSYLSAWKATPRRTALYVGEPAGKKHLESTGLTVGEYGGGELAREQVLIVAAGGGKKLAPHAASVGRFLAAGGNLLAIGLDQEETNAFLPFPVTTKKAEHIATYFEPARAGSLLQGVGPADVYARDANQIPLVTGGAARLGDGVLAKTPAGNVVFCQLAPWHYDYNADNGAAWIMYHKSHNVKWTYQHTSVLLARLLGNMGVGASTPLVARFAAPAEQGESLEDLIDAPWLEGDPTEFVLPTHWKGLPLVSKTAPSDGWETPGFDDTSWRPIRVPGLWDEQYEEVLKDRPWTFLHRVKFHLPAELADKQWTLVLGPVENEDSTYLNGKLIGSMGGKGAPVAKKDANRKYAIPQGLLRPGENLLAVRAFAWSARGGMGQMSDPSLRRHQLKRLENVDAYLPAETVRCLHGLYLDQPYPYDDPYRYWRW